MKYSKSKYVIDIVPHYNNVEFYKCGSCYEKKYVIALNEDELDVIMELTMKFHDDARKLTQVEVIIKGRDAFFNTEFTARGVFEEMSHSGINPGIIGALNDAGVSIMRKHDGLYMDKDSEVGDSEIYDILSEIAEHMGYTIYKVL